MLSTRKSILLITKWLLWSVNSVTMVLHTKTWKIFYIKMLFVLKKIQKIRKKMLFVLDVKYEWSCALEGSVMCILKNVGIITQARLWLVSFYCCRFYVFFFFHFFWIKVLLLILPGIVLMENSSMRLIHYNKISFWKKIPVFSTKYEIITKITNAETEK